MKIKINKANTEMLIITSFGWHMTRHAVLTQWRSRSKGTEQR